jgi:hypothetical protein
MADVRQMKARVEAAAKQADPSAFIGTFYDAASDRLFVTLVKGSRKISVALRGRDFSNGDSDKVDRAIKDGFKRLGHTPIG